MLLFVLGPVTADKPVALLCQLEGEVFLGDDTLALLAPLSAGDELRLVDESTVVLSFLEGGARVTLEGPGRVRVKTDGVQVLEGRQAEVWRPESRQTALVPAGVNVHKMGGLVRTEPVWTADPAFLELNPTLTWTAPEESLDGFRLTVLLDDEVVLEESLPASARRFQLPNMEREVLYNVELVGIRNDRPISDAGGWIEILDEATADRLTAWRAEAEAQAKSDPTALAILLTVYLEYELYQPALDMADRLQKMKPDDPNLEKVRKALSDYKGL